MQMFQGVRSLYLNYSMFGFPASGTQLIVITVFSILAILLCYDKWNRRRYETLTNELNGPPDYPIIGSCLESFGDHYEKIMFYGDLFNYGLFKCWFGSYLSVFITKPEDLQIILNSSKALNKGYVYKMATKLIGEGLVTAPVDKWKIHRRLMNPLFKYDIIKEKFFPIFQEKSKVLVQKIQKGVDNTQPIDILDCISSVTLSTVCQTTMDYNLDTHTDMGFKMGVIKGVELVINRVPKVWLYPDVIYNLYIKLFGYENIYKIVRNLPRHIIAKKKNDYVNKFSKKNTTDTDVNDGKSECFKGLVETLLDSNKPEERFTDEDIMGHVITMVGAGFETTSLTASFCFLMLAIYPDIQDKVYDEICSALGDSDEPITMEQTNKLVYLKQVIYETLRLFPTAPIISRQLHDDVTIRNHKLLKGTMCVISPLITHHNPELYSNPNSFNPDNFNAENVAKRHKYSFIAFSGGPRGCIGKKYGLVFLTVIITEVLRSFSVHTDMKFSDIKLKLGITLHNTVGFPITTKSRKNRHNVCNNAEMLNY
ncbi:Cytochrome P450, conserved site,Cytochrome P450,Cytochrome P450, E-class, group I [Cinara cedri]|uniref:Cytochrome P450, conserved site,Cytochrome P450,Cytochrome P450, E-class, group I n=1 Tax=Cinara cedri TaxID=506608 RepID=A0A5E4N0P8_9HEMI|nr:Cytochrome P450, conserved site,Cytochrome P450,Cytochrome P450, E-class, group I [Cinara cedri]